VGADLDELTGLASRPELEPAPREGSRLFDGVVHRVEADQIEVNTEVTDPLASVKFRSRTIALRRLPQ
jgi:hypothetical protein